MTIEKEPKWWGSTLERLLQLYHPPGIWKGVAIFSEEFMKPLVDAGLARAIKSDFGTHYVLTKKGNHAAILELKDRGDDTRWN